MTPTQILGASLLCTIFTLAGALFYRGVNSGKEMGELTGAVKNLASNVGEIKDLFKAHADRLQEHEGRLNKLEFCLDMDNRSEGIVMDVMSIRNRQRKRGGNDA